MVNIIEEAPLVKDTKTKIMDAAFLLISQKGYANVTVRDIAREAGVALSQVNYYYQNKENLFVEVIRRLKNRYMNNIRMEMQNKPTTQAKLSYFVEYCKNMISSNTSYYVLLLDLFSMSMWSEPFRTEFQLFFEDISTVVSDYISYDNSVDEKITMYKPNQVVRLIIAAIFGTAMQHISQGGDGEIVEGLDIIESFIN